MPACVEYFTSFVQGAAIRVVHDVELLLQTDPALLCGGVKSCPPLLQFPAYFISDVLILQVPDVGAEAGLDSAAFLPSVCSVFI